MTELSNWEYGTKGKAAALFVEKKGEIFTAMHDPVTSKVSMKISGVVV